MVTYHLVWHIPSTQFLPQQLSNPRSLCSHLPFPCLVLGCVIFSLLLLPHEFTFSLLAHTYATFLTHQLTPHLVLQTKPFCNFDVFRMCYPVSHSPLKHNHILAPQPQVPPLTSFQLSTEATALGNSSSTAVSPWGKNKKPQTPANPTTDTKQKHSLSDHTLNSQLPFP